MSHQCTVMTMNKATKTCVHSIVLFIINKCRTKQYTIAHLHNNIAIGMKMVVMKRVSVFLIPFAILCLQLGGEELATICLPFINNVRKIL